MAKPKNPVGAKSDKLWRGALLRAVRRRVDGKGNPQQLERMADKCVERAVKGDMTAAKEVGDRLDGRATQALELDVPVTITKIVRQIVEPESEEAEAAKAATAGQADRKAARRAGNGADASK